MTPNKNNFKNHNQKSTKKKSRQNYSININNIKTKFSKSMIENNSSNIKNLETNTHKEKILVIDLDETLIHTSFQKISNPDLKIQFDSIIYPKVKLNNEKFHKCSVKKIIDAYIRIRPGVDDFLSQLGKYYDLYVYSASSKNYLNKIIKNIDKKNLIKKCFCRDDCILYVENIEQNLDKPMFNKYKYVKDLKKINKDLRNIVFIDNNIINFKLQEKNGIPIKSFYGDYGDIELYKLIPILKNLSGFYDVRIEIAKFVKNKTFIWSKSILWLKNNCLNSAYLYDVNFILKKEKQKYEIIFNNKNNRNVYNNL